MKNSSSSIYSFFYSFFVKKKYKKVAIASKSKLSPNLASALGFTLIELLVVLVMVGVLAAIAAPGWLGFVNNQRLGSSQSRVFSTLKEAQSTAKRSGSPTIFTINNDVTKGAYATTSRSQAQYLEKGVQVSTPVTIAFNAQGLPTRENGDKFSASDFPLQITLNMANSPGRKRCTTIVTLLGSMKTGSDSECP